MIRRPPRSTLDRSSAASDVYKRQEYNSYLFVLGYQNEKKQTILRYIVFMDESKIKLLDLDLEKKTWLELISE